MKYILSYRECFKHFIKINNKIIKNIQFNIKLIFKMCVTFKYI